MKENTRQESTYPPPTRLSFPFDEARNEWLPMLLDSYYEADQGISIAIASQIKAGRNLACAKGCSHCCKAHTSIPVYPLEVIGVYWYVIEKMDPTVRRDLRVQLRQHTPGDPCPFLLNGICSIHEMRFLACRHFNVFDRACTEGEDAYYTRRQDVLTPIKTYQDRALGKMLPFHGIQSKAERKQAIRKGAIHRYVQVLQEIDWTKLAARIK